MKVLVLLAPLALLTACGSHVTVGAEPDDDGNLDVAVTEASFVVCSCHHGFGPGVDGEAMLEATNRGTTVRSFTVASVAMHDVGDPDEPIFSMTHVDEGWLENADGAGTNGSYFDFYGLDEGTETDRGVVHVAAGATVTVRTTFYLDLLTLPPESDDYVVELGFDSGDRFTVADVVTAYEQPF